MFDIGWQELFIVAILALIVVGPKDLPHAIRTISAWIRKARMMSRDFQAGVNEMVREAELDGIKDTLTNPVDLNKTITDAVDADGDLEKALTLADDVKPDIVEKSDIIENNEENTATEEKDDVAVGDGDDGQVSAQVDDDDDRDDKVDKIISPPELSQSKPSDGSS